MSRSHWQGLDALAADLGAMARNVPNAVTDPLEQSAAQIVPAARQATPRRTGRSAASITAGKVERDGNRASIEIYSDWYVMRFIEFGTETLPARRPIARAVEAEANRLEFGLASALDKNARRYGF